MAGVREPAMRRRRASGWWMLGLAAGLLPIALAASPARADDGAEPPADRIFVGGAILTMDDARPRAEALAIRGRTILAVGTRAEVLRHRGPQTVVEELGDRALLPGFIDAHGHIADYVTQWNLPNLSPPPVGTVRSIADIVERLKADLAAKRPAPGTPVLGMGYDDSLLAEHRHPTRADLDRVSTEHPVVVVHASGHLLAVNTAALARVGYTRDTPDPPGGAIEHDPATGELTGVIEEQAGLPFLALVPRPPLEERLRTLDAVQDFYAGHGVTTAQDGFSTPGNLELLRAAGRQGRLKLDVVAYPGWLLFTKVLRGEQPLQLEVEIPGVVVSNRGRLQADAPPIATPAALGPDTVPTLRIGRYEDGVKIGGIKLVADGSPQGKTAYLTQPYLHPPHGQPADYRGYPTLTQDELNAWFDAAYAHDVSLIVHANGDAAADQVLIAVQHAVGRQGRKDLRPVLIHAQTARPDQLDTAKELGVLPSFFTAHTYFWGDWHRTETLGPGRAAAISPTATALRKGLRFTNHNDSPVVPPDMLRLVGTAVNRTTRSGFVLGPDERITPLDALRAITLWAAYQYHEESSKGSLETGKLADLVVLSADPTRVDPATLPDLSVRETIKAGRTIFRARAPAPATP